MKQLIVAATHLLIYDTLVVIQYTCTIFDFTILAQYILHDDKTLYYIEHALYRLEKPKKAFEYNWFIDSKLY